MSYDRRPTTKFMSLLLLEHNYRQSLMISRRSFRSVELIEQSQAQTVDWPPGSSDQMPPPAAPEQRSRRVTLWTWLLAVIFGGIVLFLLSSPSSVRDSSSRVVRGEDSPSRQLTVVMNTFKRHDLMIDAINYYSRCSCVRYIYIIWSEKEHPSQRIVQQFSDSIMPKVFFNIQEVDSLNSRFKPLPDPHTDAVFSVDDDMRVPCGELALALEVWRSSPRSLVGFMPRIHLRGSDGLLKYRCWWKVWWTGAYSIILTKAAILHHDFFLSYTNELPRSIHELIDRRRNCEDIAMQFMMANMTSLPPIYVKGHLSDMGALGGISTSHNVVKAGHMHQRDECLNELVSQFGRNPLVRSHFVVDSADNRWNNAPSTWWEYISSDLWKWE